MQNRNRTQCVLHNSWRKTGMGIFWGVGGCVPEKCRTIGITKESPAEGSWLLGLNDGKGWMRNIRTRKIWKENVKLVVTGGVVLFYSRSPTLGGGSLDSVAVWPHTGLKCFWCISALVLVEGLDLSDRTCLWRSKVSIPGSTSRSSWEKFLSAEETWTFKMLTSTNVESLTWPEEAQPLQMFPC